MFRFKCFVMMKFSYYFLLITTITITIIKFIESRTVFDLNNSNVSHEWPLSFDQNINSTIDCGLEYLDRTIGFSFYGNNLFQFIAGSEIKVIVYFDQSKYIVNDDEQQSSFIHVNLLNGYQYGLAEIDESIAKYLRRYDQRTVQEMSLVSHANKTLFAFLYRISDTYYSYGYHYGPYRNLTVGDMRNCVFNPNCPITFARVIMINTVADGIFIFTSKMNQDSKKFVLQNFQLNHTIGYVCMVNKLDNHLQLTKEPCHSKYHNLDENDRLIQIDYGFVHNNYLYLISKINTEIWQIDSRILSDHGKRFGFNIRKMSDFFICSPGLGDEIESTEMTKTTVDETKESTTQKYFPINNNNSTDHQTIIDQTGNNNSLLIIGCILFTFLVFMGTLLFFWTKHKYRKNNLMITNEKKTQQQQQKQQDEKQLTIGGEEKTREQQQNHHYGDKINNVNRKQKKRLLQSKNEKQSLSSTKLYRYPTIRSTDSSTIIK
ncbi:hypothetical protein DERF_010680 [Dermatophagoides farinae]|uniref:Uncharacterized protein n=1 Tax=Dermatophagoides farinae TaxID=6954 RepID=A0A922L419_DERFA|nr:hypothetical protein DERF_010680 [Dermatophagoides farinae]